MEILIGSLVVIVLAQLVERHLYAKEMNVRLSEAMKAVMSRNINEFLTATTKPSNKPFVPAEQDEVDLSELSDVEFDKHIKNQNKV